MNKYFAENPQSIDVCPLQYWKVEQSMYLRMEYLAKQFLSAPLGSVSSEREFKVGKRVVTENRSVLLPGNAEKLVFLCYNTRAFNYNTFKILQEYENIHGLGDKNALNPN